MLRNHAIVEGMVSNSPLFSTPAALQAKMYATCTCHLPGEFLGIH